MQVSALTSAMNIDHLSCVKEPRTTSPSSSPQLPVNASSRSPRVTQHDTASPQEDVVDTQRSGDIKRSSEGSLPTQVEPRKGRDETQAPGAKTESTYPVIPRESIQIERSLSEPERRIDQPRNNVEPVKITLQAALLYRDSGPAVIDHTGEDGPPEPKPSPDQPADADQGVAMLLMMRRNKGKSDIHLPAPLSKAAIKTPVTGKNSAVAETSSSARGLPSSHPYYRSARVLASPLGRRGRNDRKEDGSHSPRIDYKERERKPQSATLRYQDHSTNKGASDVKYEQQKERARATNVVYRYPVRPFMQQKSASWTETERPPMSPRVYIPPPIFSPRRAPSNDSMGTRSSLSVNFNRDELVRPHSVASERVAGSDTVDRATSNRLRYLEQPYPAANPRVHQPRRELPDYADYSSTGNRPFPSPIRESFIRSDSGSRTEALSREFERRLIYQGSSAVAYRKASVSPPDLRAYDRVPQGLKRSAAEDASSYRMQNHDLPQILPRLRFPHDSSENAVRAADVKRARTDSADSSTSGSGDSAPNRMRYIAPLHGNVGSHLIPHSAVDQAQQRRQSAYRSPSPAASGQKSHKGESTRVSASLGCKDAGSILSQVMSGKSESTLDTARALADVAATLARVAESLKESMR